MDQIRVVVIVSPDVSDLYFANQLMKQLNVVGVVVEKQSEPVTNQDRWEKYKSLLKNPVAMTVELINRLGRRMKKKFSHDSMQAHQVNRAEFGDEGYTLFPTGNCKVIYTEGVNAINDPVYVEQVRGLDPDIIAVCGASIFKQDMIRIPEKGVLNLHGGLSQHYRGLWTTDWALHNEEPEYIGATVHFVSEGIDDGDVVLQGRPDLTAGDDPKLLYAKVVKLGIKMMVRAIRNIENGDMRSYPLSEKGKIYYNSMATDRMKKRTWKNARGHVIQEYLDNKTERDKPVLAMMLGAVSEQDL